MSIATVRNLPEETHRALRLPAAQHGRSMDAEILEILEVEVRPKTRVNIGSELAAFGQRFCGLIDITRDQAPAEPAIFEIILDTNVVPDWLVQNVLPNDRR